MKHNFPYLNDKGFLKEIDNMKIKEQFVKITVLDFQENPIQDIQGKVTSGNINIDGSSSLRRTCNLSMIADDESAEYLNSPKNLISLNKKIDVLIGFKNTINNKKYNKYNILWFPLGLYVIVNCSISHGTGETMLSLQLKDKMCLLNGEVGGVFPASVVFSEYDIDVSMSVELESSHALEGEYKEGTAITSKENIKTEKGGDYSLLVQGIFKAGTQTEIFQPTIFQIIQETVNHFGGEQLGKIIINDVPLKAKMVMKWIGSQPLYACYKINSSNSEKEYFYTLQKKAFENRLENGYVKVANTNPQAENGIFTSGDNIGYTYADFTYPKELSANAGDNVCSVLDQIVQTLGNYEYFYDVDGNFIFQEKKNYLNTRQATFELKNMCNPDYIMDMSKGKSIYSFDDSVLINSFSNAPQYNMIKNDFLVWGVRETVEGKTVPCRYHLVIDDKPEIGNTYNVVLFEDTSDGIIKAKVPIHVDSEDELPVPGAVGVFYEVVNDSDIRYWSVATKEYIQIDGATVYPITTGDWRTELYLAGSMAEPLATDSNYYYSELYNEWPKLYDILAENTENGITTYGAWRTGTNPTDLDFFLDFIDDSAETSQFSVSAIGRRQKVVSDNEINCLFEPTVEDIIFIKADYTSEAEKKEMEELREECEANGQYFYQMTDDIYGSLAAGKNYNSAYAYARDLLYQYTSYNESITISSIPIYYLDVNSRITVRDEESGIYGDYNINSISIPLDVTSFMNINASKVIERA